MACSRQRQKAHPLIGKVSVQTFFYVESVTAQ